MRRLNVVHGSAIGFGACAIAALVVPAALLRGLGVPDATVPIIGVMRMTGVLLLALGAVLWSARHWLLSSQGAPTLRVLSVIHGAGGVMLLGQQLTVGRVLESLVPILFVLVIALEYAGSARRLSRRFRTAA